MSSNHPGKFEGFPFTAEEIGYFHAPETTKRCDVVEDKLLPAAPMEAEGQLELASDKVKPKAGEGIDRTIIDDIAVFLGRFLFLKEETQYTLIAAWIIATHLHKTFDCLGYLFAHSPERQSGKTTLLEILDLLVLNSTGIQISPTEAVLFRTAEGHTHLLDEVDSWKNRDDLRDVLNAGYKKGGKVTRVEKGKTGGSFEPREFPVFAPRALAGIGLSILAPTTLDRTFAVPMVRQKKDEKRERFRERKIRADAGKLKGLIENWVKENGKAVASRYDGPDFPDLEIFSDRTIDIAEPLATIIEVAYAGLTKIKQARRELVQAIACTRNEQSAPSPDHKVLKRLLELAKENDPLVGSASEIAGLCANSDEQIDALAISQTLRRYGCKTKSIRLPGGEPLKRYSLSEANFQELVDRWVVEDDDPAEDVPPGTVKV